MNFNCLYPIDSVHKSTRTNGIDASSSIIDTSGLRQTRREEIRNNRRCVNSPRVTDASTLLLLNNDAIFNCPFTCKSMIQYLLRFLTVSPALALYITDLIIYTTII